MKNYSLLASLESLDSGSSFIFFSKAYVITINDVETMHIDMQ